MDRLDAIGSRLEIQQLAVRYAAAVDGRDLDTLVSLHASDPDEIGSQPFGTLPQRMPLQPTGTHVHAGDAPTDNPAHYLGLLEELHDTGVLDDDEYTAARTRLLESLRA